MSAAVVHFNPSANPTIGSIKKTFEQIHALFNQYNSPQLPTTEQFYGGIFLLRSALETLGGLLDNGGAISPQAKAMCREAKYLRHALVHGDSQMLRVVGADHWGTFATGLANFLARPSILENPVLYQTKGALFSRCDIYRQLQNYDGVAKSLSFINPEEQMAHLQSLLASSTQFTNGNALAYTWGGMLESIVRLRDLEIKSVSQDPVHLKRYEHIYKALPWLLRNFQNIQDIRATNVHSDVNAGPSWFVTRPSSRTYIQKIISDFLEAVEKRKAQKLKELADFVLAGGRQNDEDVASHPLATIAQLITIAGRTPTALNIIWTRLNNDPTVIAAVLTANITLNSEMNDIWVAQQSATTNAQLITIAARRPTALNIIWTRLNNDPTVIAAVLTANIALNSEMNDIWVAQQLQASSINLDTIARRRPAAHAFVLRNANTDTATLTWFRTNHGHLDAYVAAHHSTLAADLDIIAKRSVAAHAFILTNRNTDAATLTWFMTAYANTPSRALYDSSVIQHIHSIAADLATIAGRTQNTDDLHNIVAHGNRNAATDTAVIGNNRTPTLDLLTIAIRTQLATDLAIIAAHPNANAAVLSAVVANLVHNAASDTAVLARNQALAIDLVTIGARTQSTADLHSITAHPSRNAATDTAVINNNRTLVADLVTIAGRTQSAVDLHNIVAHGSRNAATDTVVIGNNRTPTLDLLTIATRTQLATDLAIIAAHPNANAAVLSAVVANLVHNAASDTAILARNQALAIDLVTIGARTQSTADLHSITAHPSRNAATDMAVINNNRTLAADLVTIAGRTQSTVDLHNIRIHAQNNLASDTAVVGNNFTLAVDLVAIAARSPTLREAVVAHPNNDNEHGAGKRRRL